MQKPNWMRVIVPLAVSNAAQLYITELLLTWLKQAQHSAGHTRVPPESIARIASWAIFGTAIQWSQEMTTVAAEEMAKTILMVIVDGLEIGDFC
jgi:hypothetical protein